jgi:hypothetical protein
LFPGRCLARDEDGVVKIDTDVVMLESTDTQGVNGWLRGCSHGAGDAAEATRSDVTELGNVVWCARETAELSAGPVHATLMTTPMEGFVSVTE